MAASRWQLLDLPLAGEVGRMRRLAVVPPRGDQHLPVEAGEALVPAVASMSQWIMIRRRWGEQCVMRRPSPREDRGLPGGDRDYRQEALEAGWRRPNNVVLTFAWIRHRWGGERIGAPV